MEQKKIEHSGSGIAQLIDWLDQICGGNRKRVAVGIEIPHGAIVESLSEKDFAFFLSTLSNLIDFEIVTLSVARKMIVATHSY